MLLAEVREKLGLTLGDIADATGLSIPTLSKIERQIQAPSADSMMLLDEWLEAVREYGGLAESVRLDWEWVHELVASQRAARRARKRRKRRPTSKGARPR